MTNALLTSIALLLIALHPIATATGSVEVIVRSPRTVIIEPTICAEFVCFGADAQTPARKVSAGVPLRFHSGRFNGPSLPNINLIVKVYEPASLDEIALENFRTEANNVLAKMEFATSLGFNMTVEMRNDCAENVYGKRCDRLCQVPNPSQSFCDSDGVLICKTGWTGTNCSKAICPNNCNGRGTCDAPGQCTCKIGFTGSECETCTPMEGCVNGSCENEVPGTCSCKPGFAGKLCNVDSHVCTTKKPCENGGKCTFDSRTDEGYRCDCPFDFLGIQCETPLSSVPCPPGSESLCLNGGACYKSKHIQCKCRPGFSGTFCQIGEHTDCSTKMCSSDASCRMVHSRPMCVQVATKIPKALVNELVVTVDHNQAIDDMNKNLLYTVCFILIIIGLIFGSYIIYSRIIAKSSRRSSENPAPLSTLSPSSKPSVYKVCTVSEESAENASNMEIERFYNSPPPAYSSPIVPRYKKIPTDSEVYQDCVV